MNLTNQERTELNELSKRVFGSSSRWLKLVNKGTPMPFERDREVMVPDGKGGAIKKVFVDKKTAVHHYSVEEVKTLMLNALEANKD